MVQAQVELNAEGRVYAAILLKDRLNIIYMYSKDFWVN